MGILVDTSVWSLALRKGEKHKREQRVVQILAKAIMDLSVVIIGPIRQEILGGMRGKGVHGSHIDFLICAFSLNKKHSILTLDKDFSQYRKHVLIDLLEV